MAKMKRRTLSEAAEEVRQDQDADQDPTPEAPASANPDVYDGPEASAPAGEHAGSSASRGLQIATLLVLLATMALLIYAVISFQGNTVGAEAARAADEAEAFRVTQIVPPSTSETSAQTQTAIAQTEVALAQTEAALALAEAAIAQAQAALSQAEGLPQQNASGQGGERDPAMQEELVRSLGTTYDVKEDSSAAAPDSTQN